MRSRSKNGDKATAPWKNVVAYDTLPAGVKLIGNVYLDGKVALHKLNGNALSVLVGGFGWQAESVVNLL